MKPYWVYKLRWTTLSTHWGVMRDLNYRPHRVGGPAYQSGTVSSWDINGRWYQDPAEYQKALEEWLERGAFDE